MLKIDFSVISNYNELKESIFFEITNFINEKLNSNEQRQQKIDFLNQGTNSKDFLLNQVISLIKNYYSFIIKSKVNSKKTSYLTSDDLETLYEFSYQSRINWFINPVTSLIEYRLIKKRKRQLSLKSSGSYYTPTELCTFMAKTSINTISLHKEDLITEFFNSINHELCEMEINNIILFLKKIIPIKLIDISVGSGRFLRASLPFLIVYLKKIKNIVLSEIKKKLIGIENEKNSFLFSELMKKIDIEIPFLSRNLDESENSSKIINFLIKNCIFGIDIDEKAVELSKILLKIRIIEILGKNNQNISSEIKILHRNSIISVKKTTMDQPFIRNLKKLNGIIWERDFPEVFSYIDKFDKKNDDRQGFDLVIGNPPWEILKPNDREFFRNYIPDFQKQSRKEQDTLKKQILKKYPKIRHHYDEYINNITSMIKFIKINKLFAYQGSIINGRMETGDPQLFKFLLEIAFQITAKNGIISYLIQHNFLGSKGNSGLRKLFLDNGKFDGIWEFYNKIDEKIFFPNVDLKQRFIIIKYLKKNQVSKI
ncbi:MAG: hypothetical protein GY870_05925, partial [archaeon]|nr:hypothetical protein [archaeon]